MIFSFFILLSISTLSPGENPYDILGVSKFASADEIKRAFRKIVFEHHPDRHKDAESYQIFLKANDAYELLSDQEKKLQYDRDGKVSEHSSESHSQQYERKENLPLITQHIFPGLARDGSEWIILLTQHFDCPECSRQQHIFEEFYNEVKHYVKVARVDVSSSPDFVDKLKVTKLPQWCSVRYINGSIQGTKLGTTFKSKNSAIEALFKFWSKSRVVQTLKSMNNLNQWLQVNSNKAHVLEILPRNNDGTSIHFRYACSKIGEHAIFASITESSELNQKYMIKKAPCILIFRGHNTLPIQITTSGRRLMDDIEEYTTPVFAQLSWSNYEGYCKEWCVLSCGLPNSSYIESVYDRPFTTAFVDADNSLAKALNLTNGKWVAISKDSYIDVNVPNSDALVSLCSRLYRNDGIGNENVKEIPNNKIHKAFDSFTSKMSTFEISNGSLTFVPLMITIPIPFLIIGSVLIAVFLFINGVTSNSKVESPIPNRKASSEMENSTNSPNHEESKKHTEEEDKNEKDNKENTHHNENASKEHSETNNEEENH